MTTVLHARNPEGTYSFSSEPKVVQKRKLFKENLQEEETEFNYGNLMYDRRVFRGNTYALQVLPANAQPDPLELQKELERKRRALARRRIKEELRPKSPMPVEGKLNKPVQTELYLETLTDFVEEADIDCQTDAFLDRPPTPYFVPAKIGKDIETQIYDGELFTFDLEVVPVLEVLIGKTVEQALLEVMEEEELARIRSQQNAFEEIRQADLLEAHRLAERDRRIREEKERRKAEYLERETQEKEVADKVAAQAFAKAYLSNLEPNVFNNLAENGYFYDPVERDVEDGFLPWLMNEIEDEINLEIASRLLLDNMISEIVQERHHEYRQLELMAAEKALMKVAGLALGKDSSQVKTSEQNKTATDEGENQDVEGSSQLNEPTEEPESSNELDPRQPNLGGLESKNENEQPEENE